MDEKIDKILDMIIAGLGSAGDAVVTELPLLVSEYVIYYMIGDAALLCFGLFSILIAMILFIGAWRTREGNMDARMALALAGWVALVLGIPAVYYGGSGTLKAYYAPKAYIIEKLRK